MFSLLCLFYLFFFFNDTATTEIYTLSLHDALPILLPFRSRGARACSPSLVVLGREAQHRSHDLAGFRAARGADPRAAVVRLLARSGAPAVTARAAAVVAPDDVQR